MKLVKRETCESYGTTRICTSGGSIYVDRFYNLHTLLMLYILKRSNMLSDVKR